MRRDLIKIFQYLGAIVGAGQSTIVTLACSTLHTYVLSVVADCGLFHQSARSMLLGTAEFEHYPDVDGVDVGGLSALVDFWLVRKDRAALRLLVTVRLIYLHFTLRTHHHLASNVGSHLPIPTSIQNAAISCFCRNNFL